MGDGDADRAPPLALETDAVVGDAGLAAAEERGDHFQELAAVYRAAAQLEVDIDVVGDRGGGGECVDVVGAGVDGASVLVDIGEVVQRLDAAGGRAGPDRHQAAGGVADRTDPFGIAGCGDRAFDEREIVGPRAHGAGGFQEVRDLHLPGEGQEFVLAVEEGQLAAVAGGELEHREGGDPGHLTTPLCRAGVQHTASRPPDRPGRAARGRAGSARSYRSRSACCVRARP